MNAKTVMVIDDERDIRDSLRDVLIDEGYEVLLAGNGREALTMLPEAPRPLVVILDIIMPIMSGGELYTAMQADPRLRDIPVVISTSDPSRTPSGVPIMKKPVNLGRLLTMIAALF
jgi:CheY-like chemotaxis protein